MGLEACWVGSSTALKMRGRLTTEGTHRDARAIDGSCVAPKVEGWHRAIVVLGAGRIEGGKFIATAAPAQARQRLWIASSSCFRCA